MTPAFFRFPTSLFVVRRFSAYVSRLSLGLFRTLPEGHPKNRSGLQNDLFRQKVSRLSVWRNLGL